MNTHLQGLDLDSLMGNLLLDLIQSLMKDLGDIKQTNNVSFFVTDGLIINVRFENAAYRVQNVPNV